MDHSTRESRTTSKRGIKVQKSLDTRQFQHPVVLFTLRSNRDEPVEVRVTEKLPAVGARGYESGYRHTDRGIWWDADGQVMFDCRLAPGEELTTLYMLACKPDDVAEWSLENPSVEVVSPVAGGWNIRSRLKSLAVHTVAGLVFISVLFVALAVVTSYTTAVFLSVYFLLVGVIVAGLWKVFAKAGRAGWKAVIPVYNLVVIMRISGNPWWYTLGLVVPFVQLIVLLKMYADLSKSFGKGLGFALGLAVLPFIFWPLLGFGAYSYQGDRPRGDRDVVTRAVKWRGNVEHPAFASTVVDSLQSGSFASLTSHELRYALEAVEAYQEVGAADYDFDAAHDALRSRWEATTGADWETTRAH